MSYLPGDLYTVEAGEKISDDCKYPLILFSISKWKKYRNFRKIAQLSNWSKSRITGQYTQTVLYINDQTKRFQEKWKIIYPLLLKNRVRNAVHSLEKLMKVILFLTFLNKNGVYNTSDDLEGQGKKRKTEFLERLVRFKFATRVALALNIHKQDCQLTTKHKMF